MRKESIEAIQRCDVSILHKWDHPKMQELLHMITDFCKANGVRFYVADSAWAMEDANTETVPPSGNSNT